MADHAQGGPVELGAPMDYAEHNKTYSLFLALVKWGIIANVALLIAMAFGFFAGGGFIFSTLLFIVLVALGGYILR